MLDTSVLREAFARGLDYDAYLAAAKPGERPGWDRFLASVALAPAQAALVRGFARRVNVLCLSGTWCGDCVQQVPILHRIHQAHPAPRGAPNAPGIDLRYLERDAHLDLADRLRICGGQRVPVVVFMNEDAEFVALAGDRPLSRYRALAARHLGPSCPLPGAPVPADELAATVADWLNEFERVALLLRLSSKLRQRHGD